MTTATGYDEMESSGEIPEEEDIFEITHTYLNQTQQSLDNVGIIVNTFKNIATDKNYMKIKILVPLEPYIEQLNNITIFLRETKRQTIEFTEETRFNFSNTIFFNKSETERIQICRDFSQTDIKREVKESLCTILAVNAFLNRSKTESMALHDQTLSQNAATIHTISTILEVYRAPNSRNRREVDVEDYAPLYALGVLEQEIFGVALQSDLAPIRKAIKAGNDADVEVLIAIKQSLAVLDSQSKHIKALNAAVRELQQLSKRVSINLLTEFQEKETNNKVLLNAMQLQAANAIYTQAISIISRIRGKISDIQTILKEAVSNAFGPTTINPETMLQTLKDYSESRFRNNETYLWKTETISDMYEIYEKAKVQFERSLSRKIPIITITIPIISQETIYQHHQITVLPTRLTAHGLSTILQLEQPTNQIQIMTKDEEMYIISGEDILNHNKDTVSLYRTKELEIPTIQKKICISAILSKQADIVTQKCKFMENIDPRVIFKLQPGQFAFSVMNPTYVIIFCHNNEKLGRKSKQIAKLEDYGTISIPERCDLETPERKYFGEPTEWEHTIVRRDIVRYAINDYSTFSPTIWLKILENTTHYKMERLENTVKMINDLNIDNLTRFDNNTRKLMETLEAQLFLAHLARTKASFLVRLVDSPTKISIITMMILLTIIFAALIGIMKVVCCVNKRKPFFKTKTV